MPGFGNAILPSTGCVWSVSLRNGKVKMEGELWFGGLGFLSQSPGYPSVIMVSTVKLPGRESQ